MRCNKHRLVLFNAGHGPFLELIKRELVLLCWHLGSLKVKLLVVATRVDRLMDTVVILKCLNFEIIRIVAKLADS